MSKYITAALAFLIISCGNTEQDGIDEKGVTKIDHKTQLNMSDIEISSIQKSWFELVLTTNGEVELPPSGRHKISLVYGGKVDHVSAIPGQQVKRGQLLCQIQNPQFIEWQREYLSGMARSSLLKNDVERKEKLLANQGVSTLEYEKAKSLWQENEVLTRSLDAQLKLVGISTEGLTLDNIRSSVGLYSPVNGYVNEVNISPGQYVQQSDVLLEVLDMHHVHAHLNLFDKDLNLVEKGQRVRLFASHQNKSIGMGQIKYINKQFTHDNVLGVHVEVDGGSHDEMNIGAYVQAEIIIREDSAWTIMKESIVRNSQGIDGVIIATNEDDFLWQPIEIEGINGSVTAISKFWEGAPPKIVQTNAYKVYADMQ